MIAAVLVLSAGLGLAQHGDATVGDARPSREAFRPRIEPASDEARAAIERFELQEGFATELFAAEPMLANPVCLWVTGAGDVYVAETFRHNRGVTDIRDHMAWKEDDLASRTVEDRRALLRKWEGDGYAAYGEAFEQIRLVRDTDRDGRADEAVVYARDFTDPTAGIGAGLLEHEGAVYYTCIPDLWRLADGDGDGVAEDRRVVSTGYGVNIAMLGHDLHGLRIGPDGRLYFSCGDRGFSVETERGRIDHAHTGAVLRCELDGSQLEVVHTGLRNPQELAFDDWGDLFTGDNNSDGGDRARWVHVVQDGDSGWRYSYQWLGAPWVRGPWNDEKLWHPHHPGQAAYLVPPVANRARGPSGLAHYPGTGFPERYRDHFFLVDFVGSARHSGVESFRVERRGASFDIGPVERFAWGVLATDADFGPDGALWITDWVSGWEKTGKGRVYRVVHPAAGADPVLATTRRYLARGVGGETSRILVRLLRHPDQRVRQAAHLELAARGAEGVELLAASTTAREPLLARVHAIWGLWVAARRDPAVLATLVSLLGDEEPEIRAQAARVLGDLRHGPAHGPLAGRLDDDSARVRFHAAIGVGRLGVRAAVPALVEVLREARDTDTDLRHAAVVGLVGCAAPEELVELADDPSPFVRLGAVVALRRRSDPGLVRFLADDDALVVVEAARAIHDVPVDAALPVLAGRLPDLAGVGGASTALVRRAVNAADRLGASANAAAVAAFAARAGSDPVLRVEALQRLTDWGAARNLDPVLGHWLPRAERDDAFVPELALEVGASLVAERRTTPEPVLTAWVALARGETGPAAEAVAHLDVLFSDPTLAAATRVAAFGALVAGASDDAATATLCERALVDAAGVVRAAALPVLERLDPEVARPRLGRILATGELAERRAAYRVLARDPARAADERLSSELERLAAGLAPVEVALDLVRAAERRDAPSVAAALDARRAAQAEDPELAPWLDGLFGGDARAGERIFREKNELSCLRCHAVDDDAAERDAVGPGLKGVGQRLGRRQLLESIVAPNRHLTLGFTATALHTDTGLVAGRIVEEDDEWIVALNSDGQRVEVAVEDVELRKRDLSAMPEGLAEHLSRREMRDLIEYLAQL